MSPTIETITLTWWEVREQFLRMCKPGARWVSQPTMGESSHFMQNWQNKPTVKDKWEGGSASETIKWIEQGYKSPAFDPGPIPYKPRNRKRPRWNSESGDVDTSRLLGGSDDFYLERGESQSLPGLSIGVNMFFAAGVTANVIANYGAWVASLIAALETQGYDLEVSLDLVTDGLFNRDDQRRNVRVVVKEPNTVSDFASWSVLFAPTGFRHLLLSTAQCLAADKVGKEATGGLGMSLTTTWDVKKDDHVITIYNSQRGNSFTNEDPTEILTNAAKREGLI